MPLILLAEDESSTIDHVRSALSSQGWLVKTVGDRDQALRAASEFAPQLVLVNDRLAGAQDLIRTFSRRSGGPGVILLSTDDGEIQAAATSPDVEAILAKPLDTSDLIETIRQGLVDGGSKPPALPVADTKQVFSSEDIFGDLLDDILDPEVELEPEAVTSSPEPIAQKPVVDDAPVIETKPKPKLEPRVEKPVLEAAPEPEPETRVEEPVFKAEPVIDIAHEADLVDVPEPVLEETPATAKAADADQAGGVPVAGLEDLEEVVREGVEAWADSIDPDDTEESDSDTLAEAQPKSEPEPKPEPEPELEEDLESKLEDTLAGVLAASLSQVNSAAESTATASQSVDDLLSQALGDLNLGAIGTAPTDEEVMESAIDDDIQALAASVEFESIAEIGETDLVAEEPEPVDTETEIEVSEDAEKAVEKASEETLETAAESVEEEVEPLDEIAASPGVATTGVEFGEYTLEQQIGVGGMASVWKARRKGVEGFEKRVAIKKILPQAAENEDFVEMFIDEAKLAAQLNHSNITHIYDLGKIDDDYFIAMEYVEGRNLRQILNKTRKKQQPVPVGVALFVASQIADALDYAHRSKDFDDAELGLVHRDVSPQNVLISFEGDIKLCDFGIAKAVSKISTTQMGALKGKLQYMSPEQAWGKSIDHRSDLFSLGILLYEMLTGERLFSGESEMAVLEAVREADVGTQIIQSPDIPAGVKGVLLRTLAKEPDDRFESAADLQRGLQELLKDESPAPGPKSLAAFVRELLDMQDELPEPIHKEEPEPRIEVAEEQEWVPESSDTEEEDETTPWLRRILTRLLPVILVVGVGGGIIAGLMQKEAPVTPSPSKQSPAVAKLAVLDPRGTDEATAVDPQGQPPPTSVAADPTPAPPTQPQTRDPEPEPVIAAEPPVAEAKPEETAPNPAPEAIPGATDPELERQVKEDLERVQELMATPADSPPVAPPPDQPMTLESLWSDATAADETPDDSEAEAQLDGPVQPGPGVVEPQVLEFERPEYTDAARQAGVEGTIRVSVLVGENGRALEVRLIQGLDSQLGLEEALIEAARNAVYQPASQDGTPVKMWYQVAVLFQP